MFFKQTKDCIKKRAHKILPDGGVVQQTTDSWQLWETPPSYTKHVFDDKAKEIISYTYGDLTLSEASLEKVRHLRVHVRPYRLELWIVVPPQRRAGDAEKVQLMNLLDPVFEQAKSLGD